MHVGHCRGAVFGDALANLLAFAGYDVTREYYINDAGAQVDALARSAYLRYREALGEDIGEIPAGLYPGDYLKPVGAALADGARPRAAQLCRRSGGCRWCATPRSPPCWCRSRRISAALNITHDVFFSERSLTRRPRRGRARRSRSCARKGSSSRAASRSPRATTTSDWEDREQTLFRSTAFGDDVDRALMKSDGSYTYFAADIAYHHNKLARGFRHLINVFGADHVGYITRMKAAVAALSDGKARSLDIKVVPAREAVPRRRAGATCPSAPARS